MSYIPDNQLLCPGIEKMLEGTIMLRDAALRRIADPSEWCESHLQELVELNDELTRLELRLRKLHSESR